VNLKLENSLQTLAEIEFLLIHLEMSDLAKELSNLPALPALGEPGAASASGWGPLQKSSQQLSKCFMR